jgi:ribosomal protein L11 methyltransferase
MGDKNFIEVSLRSAVDPGELVSLLEDQGVLGCWEEDGILRLYWDQERWHPAVERRVREVLENFGERMAAAGLEVSCVPDRDWNAAWAASLHPIRLGRRIRIRQSWHPRDAAFDGVELVIDPGRAFGSGYHATTQMVIEWMEERIRPGDTVLDIGTGSGILAMIALRLGAASALGIDSDPAAIGCARELAEANGFGPELDLRAVSFEDLGPGAFDVVLANLDIRNLPSLCAPLPGMMSEGGRACLSGLLNEDYEKIACFLERARMAVTARMERDGWTALEVRRADRPGYSGPCAASLDP